MSFNRNQKRVAGPGFHVNVRYDDNGVCRMRQQNKVHPFLAQGARLTEVHDVKEQELLVTMNHEKGKSAHYFDGYTHCFSAVNGFSKTAGFGNLDDLKEHILSCVKFVGIATTEFVPKPGFQEQGFVSQVGGVVTLVNESTTDIHPGDSVKLDLNLSHQRGVVREKGIPREKIRFTVARAETSSEILDKAIAAVGLSKSLEGVTSDSDKKRQRYNITSLEQDLKSARGQYEKAKRSADTGEDVDRLDALKDEVLRVQKELESATALCSAVGDVPGETTNTRRQLKAIIKKVNELNQRIIGRACSFARKGDRLEVLLQPRNPY